MKDPIIDELRQRLVKMNGDLLSLLNERAKIVVELGMRKHKSGLPVYEPAREKEMLASLKAMNPGPFSAEQISSIFLQIFEASRWLVQEQTKEE